VAYFKDAHVRASYGAADGLGRGLVSDLRIDRDGTLWAATEGGLSRLKNGRIATLTGKNGLPCDAVQWSMEDDAQSVWLYTPCGLVRIARAELDRWAAAVDKAQPLPNSRGSESNGLTIQATVFDTSDGVRSRAGTTGYGPLAAKSSDGRLWFGALDGVSVVDPGHLPFNKLPPPVVVETVKVNGKEVAPAEGMELSHSSNDLEIDYTALSFTIPERVQFRYKLEGHDADWQDVGTRRQAFYGGLAPKQYRFRVMACNNDGVWNEAGAAWSFSIVPAYYQTLWFQGLCVLAFLALLAGLYQLRLQQVEKLLGIRMEERVNERTRIARDLHDTLLQSFQGVLLKFHAVTFMLPDRAAEAQETLEDVIEQARKAIAEGRDAVQGLRSSAAVGGDLAVVIGTLGDELAGSENAPCFGVQVEGTPRDLVPMVRDEAYRIACEAVRNAFRHAHAGRIEVEIRYDRRRLRLRVRDDGKGMDPKILAEGGRSGHHGLPGMHERARLVGGKLAIWSKLDFGTEAELTIPAAVAYAKGT
jgi:signal transduction histidine kinase